PPSTQPIQLMNRCAACRKTGGAIASTRVPTMASANCRVKGSDALGNIDIATRQYAFRSCKSTQLHFPALLLRGFSYCRRSKKLRTFVGNLPLVQRRPRFTGEAELRARLVNPLLLFEFFSALNCSSGGMSNFCANRDEHSETRQQGRSS